MKHGTSETPDKDSLVLTSMLVDAYNCVGSVSSLAAVQSSIRNDHDTKKIETASYLNIRQPNAVQFSQYAYFRHILGVSLRCLFKIVSSNVIQLKYTMYVCI